MSKLLWTVAGTTLGLAAYALLKQPSLQPALQPAPVDSVDKAANKVGTWGTKQRAFGVGGQLKGKVEQGAGNLTGNADLADKGTFDEAAGAVKDAAGKVAQALETTVHDLNK